MDFNRNLRIVRTSGSSYPFPYKNNVLWVHHDENNNPVSEIWDHCAAFGLSVVSCGAVNDGFMMSDHLPLVVEIKRQT